MAEPLISRGDSPIRGVADTARWVAIYRANESERPDAVFHDPYARRLAGPRGQQIADAMPGASRASWAFVARTVLFDEFILQQVRAGVTLVVNLAAGLDTRPYRMPLPSTLKWVEVDQPEIIEEKAALLAGERPVCSLERITLDLAAETPRRALLKRLGQRPESVLIITEGLLPYLTETQVASLADDLAAQPGIGAWIVDVTSPRLMQIIRKDWGRRIEDAGAILHFAPEQGPEFFRPHGWISADLASTLTTAARLRRLPFILRLLARLPSAGKFHPRRPWSGVCLLRRADRPA